MGPTELPEVEVRFNRNTTVLIEGLDGPIDIAAPCR